VSSSPYLPQQKSILTEVDRYWGESSPYADLTAETLQLLTLNQAIQDFVLFAKTVYLPFDKTNSSNAAKAPWVFMGGSYSGALTAWTESISPSTFWAYHASSAPVEAIDNYVGSGSCVVFISLIDTSGNILNPFGKGWRRTVAKTSIS